MEQAKQSFIKNVWLYIKAFFVRDKEKEAKRIWEIDFLRGIIILAMVVDHLIGDFWYLFPAIFSYSDNAAFMNKLFSFSLNQYWMTEWRVTLRYVGLMLLVILTGISSKFSKKNLLRGFLVLIVGIFEALIMNIVSLFTFEPELTIFSTLLCLGILIIIFSLFKISYFAIAKAIRKKKNPLINDEELNKTPNSWKWFCLALGVILLIANYYIKISAYNIDHGPSYFPSNNYLIFAGFNSKFLKPEINGIWANISFNDFLSILIGTKQYGADYLCLFPSIGYVFIGGFTGETLYKDKKSFVKFFSKDEDDYYSLNARFNKVLTPFTWSGKNTLLIYILHQPAIVLTIGVILLILGCKISL